MFGGFARTNIKALARSATLAIGFALFAAVVVIDYVTSYELALTPFYLFVVLLITWGCGWKWGFFFCCLALAAGLAVGVLSGHPYSEPIYFYVEHANRLVSYLIIMGLATRLRTLHEHEKESARLDNLTGVLNQKGFYEALGIEMKRHRRERAALSVAYIDCDNFKEVNDRFGHKEGDRLLAQVAQSMRATLRGCDLARSPNRVGANPTQVTASHGLGIEPCSQRGNPLIDA